MMIIIIQHLYSAVTSLEDTEAPIIKIELVLCDSRTYTSRLHSTTDLNFTLYFDSTYKKIKTINIIYTTCDGS